MTNLDPAQRIAAIMQPNLRVLAMELDVGGHHPGYIQILGRYWAKHSLRGELTFLVTPKFITKHPDVVEELAGYGDSGVRLISLTEPENAMLESCHLRRYLRGWDLLNTYARDLRVDHAVVMYYDFFQVPSVVGPRLPCPFSVIYFRPTFHYHMFAKFEGTWRERFKAFRKRLVFAQVLKNPRLANVFCLDPFVPDYVQRRFHPKSRIVYFPDPVRIRQEALDVPAFRASLGIEAGRRVFLLFGALDRRKGVLPLLEAVGSLSTPVAEKICLLLAGQVHPSHRDEVYQKLDQLRRNSAAQVVLRDEFVAHSEVQRFYQGSDVVLTTYQRHMGMSSVLVWAAAAGKPVLSASYGLMGELVRRRKLGAVVDAGDPQEIARGIERWAQVDLATVFDAEEAARFARENDSAETGRVFFGALLGA